VVAVLEANGFDVAVLLPKPLVLEAPPPNMVLPVFAVLPNPVAAGLAPKSPMK
jgi:hypothetical protein